MRSRLALLALLLGACSADPAANPAPRCDQGQACAAGLVCHRGFCVLDGASGSDAGPTVTPDGGPPECVNGATRECYTANDPLTQRVGECRGGTQVCIEGRWSAQCFGEQVPIAEIACNGRNDDCDTDPADDQTSGKSCDTLRPGRCALGSEVCAPGGGLTCVETSTPTEEVCNGEDDDCDGQTDEIELRCFTGPSGCSAQPDGTFVCVGGCRAGRQTCAERAAGTCREQVVPAMTDGCTASATVAAIDDDCDGDIDEDCACNLGETRSCYGGPPATAGVGPCRAGTVTCEQVSPGTNRFGECTGERVPSLETCGNDGADDDCNGRRDDVPDRGQPCASGQNGICAEGVRDCRSGALVCVPATARPSETCNQLDDDCDGSVDEGFDFTGNAHCGRCNNACAAGLSCCNGSCVDLTSDEGYCGRCNVTCGASRACCGGTCTSTQTDPQSCGVCGARCAQGQVCCGGRCIDATADRNNCGACGRTCAAGQSCCNGQCSAPNAPACTGCSATCGAGEVCCAPIAPVCSDPMTDEARCGGCDRPACGPGQLCCGGTCIDRSDTSCTACNVGCGPGSLCCGGNCVPRNEANCAACGDRCSGANPECCGGSCTSTRRDEANCGGCNMPCSGVCCDGQCITDSNSNADFCGPNCIECPFIIGGGCVAGLCVGL